MKKLVSYVFLWTAVVTITSGGCQSMTDEAPTSSLREHYYFVKKNRTQGFVHEERCD